LRFSKGRFKPCRGEKAHFRLSGGRGRKCSPDVQTIAWGRKDHRKGSRSASGPDCGEGGVNGGSGGRGRVRERKRKKKKERQNPKRQSIRSLNKKGSDHHFFGEAGD